jgi:hypothetical protein
MSGLHEVLTLEVWRLFLGDFILADLVYHGFEVAPCLVPFRNLMKFNEI